MVTIEIIIYVKSLILIGRSVCVIYSIGGRKTDVRGRRTEARSQWPDGREEKSAQPPAKGTACLIEKEILEKRMTIDQ